MTSPTQSSSNAKDGGNTEGISELPFPHLSVLCHLQDYNSVAEAAHTKFKSCVWQLTKSRHRKGGSVMMRAETSFLAASLREEWRAQQRLVDCNTDTSIYNTNDEATTKNVDNDVADLLDEQPDITSTKKSMISSKEEVAVVALAATAPPKWRLQNTLQEKENANIAVKRNTTMTSTTTTGLRQRKTNNSKQSDEDDDNDNTWTHVDKDNDLEEKDKEEMKLLRQDPIDFFGLPTHDLKLAQEQAKLALEGYIQAANQAAQVLAIVNAQQQ